MQHANTVRAKLAELGLSDDDLAAAVAWARQAALSEHPAAVEPKAPYRAKSPRRRNPGKPHKG